MSEHHRRKERREKFSRKNCKTHLDDHPRPSQPRPSDDHDDMRSLIVITRWQDETAMGEDANMINLHV